MLLAFGTEAALHIALEGKFAALEVRDARLVVGLADAKEA